MKYTSQNGCFYYYDSVLYRWQIAEPTLLFILGLESVLSSDKSQTDKITISKYIYHTYSDKVEPLNYIHEIFDDIYSFLSKIGSVEDFEHYIKFNCYGLKLILNELTGSSTDRTIPIIFKNDTNKLIVSDLIADMSPTSDSHYDCQAKVIIDTFSNAGYELTLDTPGKPNFLIYKSNSHVKEELAALLDDDNAPASRVLRKKLLRDIATYNDDLIAKHKERLQTESIYNLIDYKAMYAYSLGVLYGCRCIGFEDTVIWRLDPKFWYNGEYNNLVRTAWFAFRFHWTLKDDDKLATTLLSNRQLIQDNKIWNFKNTEDIVNPPLAQDEHQCFCLYVNQTTGEKVSESLIYSLEKKIDESEQRGSFLRKYISLTNGRVIWKWLPITTKVQDGDSNGDSQSPMKGVISSRDTPLIRYIGNDQVTIYRAYQYSKDEFLAPKPDGVYKKYFVYTGDLGWVDFKENSFCDNNSQILLDNVTNSLNGSYTEVKNFLSTVPEKPDIKYLRHAYPKEPSSEVSGAITYYKCYVTDNNDETLYGVYNKYIDESKGNYYIDSNIPSNFYQILSHKLFSSLYGNIESGSISGDIYNAFYYDLNKEIKLTLKNGTIVGSHGDGETEDHTPEYFGYSTEPSSLLTLYYTKENEIAPVYPLEKEYRYISKGKNSLHWNIDENSRLWVTVNNDNDLSSKYRLTDKVINMYRGEVKISNLINMPVYNNYSESLGNQSNTLAKYIYCNESLLFDSVDRYNFIAVGNYENQDTLYRLGITEYLCPFVKEDDDKNSLLDDDGKPLVWYDPKYDVYWNGLYSINRWQKTKPSRNSLSMFDTIANILLPVFVDSETQLISIDGEEAITYDMFYSNSNYGVVRTKLKVFNPEISDEIKECYCDTKSDPNDYANAIYCIPGITVDGWKSRSEITELAWWFVDGTTTLYSGSESNEFVTDNDHND